MSSDSFVDLTALLLGFEERLVRKLGSELHQIRSEIRQQGQQLSDHLGNVTAMVDGAIDAGPCSRCWT